MKTSQAFDIVYQLALDNVEEMDEIDDDVKEARQEALDIVHDFIVNNLGEDEELDRHHSMYCDLVNTMEFIEQNAKECMDKLRKNRKLAEEQADNGDV